LLVDEIGEVIEVHREQYEETPASLELSQRELLQGVYKLDGRLMLMLEPERVAAIAITSGPAVVAG
ncbi:MAG: chemotaxis protein CheW, partial [Bryobacterales bacterium]|nr:chemotaxis protein CheW [Bryobacterales bacterium]